MSICICLYLHMIKWWCALPQKNLNEGISVYAYLFMSSFVVVVGEKWGIKDEKMNDMRGGLGAKPPRSQSILMPEKKMEIIFVTPPPPMDS